MTKKAARNYGIISFLVILSGNIILFHNWGGEDKSSVSNVIAIILLAVGWILLATCLTRLIVKYDVDFGVGDIASRWSQDYFKFMHGKKIANTYFWVSNLIFVVIIAINVFIIALFLKKYNLV